MDKFEEFIGAKKIIEEAPDLKIITDHLRQYPVIAIFAAILYRSNPETYFELSIWFICTFALMLLTATILTQASFICVALIGNITSLNERSALSKVFIFPLAFAFGIIIFYSLVAFLIKLIPSI